MQKETLMLLVIHWKKPTPDLATSFKLKDYMEIDR